MNRTVNRLGLGFLLLAFVLSLGASACVDKNAPKAPTAATESFNEGNRVRVVYEDSVAVCYMEYFSGYLSCVRR